MKEILARIGMVIGVVLLAITGVILITFISVLPVLIIIWFIWKLFFTL